MVPSYIKDSPILQPLRRFVRRCKALPQVVEARRALSKLQLGADLGQPRICYVTRRFPEPPAGPNQLVLGGAVKLGYLTKLFPHESRTPTALYIVSSVEHPAMKEIVDRAKALGLPIVLNQNGVYYKAWYGDGWQERNAELAYTHRNATHIFYQSNFCKRSAERFLGVSSASSEILYNPIDLELFTPASRPSGSRRITILTMAATHGRQYRVELAIQTLAILKSRGVNAELFIPGYNFIRDKNTIAALKKLAGRHQLQESDIRFAPSYTRLEAPKIFQSAQILLHPAYNDPSPNIVGEALACGLPVVYSDSGGVPELVGAAAGVGVPVEESYDTLFPPNAEDLAAGCEKIINALELYSHNARERAKTLLSAEIFSSKHAQIFGTVSR